jgi:hypothetical protein
MSGAAKRKVLAASLFLVGSLVASYRWLQEPRELQVVGFPISLDMQGESVKNIKAAWIAPNRHLMATLKSGVSIKLVEWNTDTLSSRSQPIHLVEMNNGELLHTPNPAFPVEAFAFSSDGSRFAWAESRTLRISSVDMDRNRTEVQARLPLRRSSSVSSITFMGDDLAAVIYKDGKIEAWDVQARRRGSAGSWLNQPWSPWRYGSRLVVTSFRTGDIGEIVFSGSGNINMTFQRLHFLDGSTIAVSDSGKIIVGTLSGKVLEVESDPEGKEQVLGYLPSTKDATGVQSLAFWDDNIILAASASSGVYARIGDSSMEKISKCPPSGHLVVGKGFLAYATSSDLEVASLIVASKILSDRGFWFSSIIALLGLCGTFWAILRS